MSIQLNIAEAKAKLSEMVDLAIAGDNVIIARAGKPVARIVAFDASNTNRSNFFGGLAHLGPVSDDAISAEPADAFFGFEVEADVALDLAEQPNALARPLKD